jgi:hypothetical protein
MYVSFDGLAGPNVYRGSLVGDTGSAMLRAVTR